VIGGNTISALSGLLVTQIVHDQLYACGLAVGLAIAAMTLTRSLHPPGGGMALTTVIGGASIAAKGAMFAFAPVCLNSLILVLVAWAFHRVSGHSYPHKPPQAARTSPIGGPDIRPEDIDAAITDMGEALDINRRDLDRLLIEAQRNARARAARE
jgi:CBS domain-containing membrane protein